MVAQTWFLSFFFFPLPFLYGAIFIAAIVTAVQKIQEKRYNYSLTAMIFLAITCFFKAAAHAFSAWDMFEGYRYVLLTNGRVFFALLLGMITTCMVFDVVMLSWAKVNAIVKVQYELLYKIALGVTITKHIIMLLIWLAYLILRYVNVPEQTPLRIVFTVWICTMLLIMLCFLAIIFYQMAQLMKNTQQESVKMAQKKLLITFIIIFIFGFIGILATLGGGFIQVFCRELACISVQEISLFVGECSFSVIFFWLIFVTYTKKSAVSKVLANEGDAAPEKTDHVKSQETDV